MAKLVRICPKCGDEQVTDPRTNMKLKELILDRLLSLSTTQVCLNNQCREWFPTKEYGWRVDPTPRAKVPSIRVQR